MPFPHHSTVEGLQRGEALLHIREASQPDKAVRILQIPKLPYHRCSHRFLGFDECSLEEFNQHVPLPRMKSILPEFQYGAERYRCFCMFSLVHVILLLSDKECSSCFAACIQKKQPL